MVNPESIRERITRKPADLVISRVPKNTLDRFKEFANNDEFSNDFGMALKWLVDFYYGAIPSGIEHLEQAIEQIGIRLNNLEQPAPEEKKPTRLGR